MIIYRVVTPNGLFVSKWFTSLAKCNRLIRKIQFDTMAQIQFGKIFKIEKAELEID